MSKRIIACSDGTGNTAVKDRGTNVFKLFEALDLTSHRTYLSAVPQVAFYDDGVGTETFKPLKIIGGAFGWGLSRNVKRLYEQIVRVYDPGDELYLFGFSRGAFTVRTLAGFIAKCGLLDCAKFSSASQLDSAVEKAYAIYRDCYRTTLAKLLFGPSDSKKVEEFRQFSCHEQQPRVRFMGVWDTVDAVGLPFHFADVLNNSVYRFKFPDNRLNSITDRACQALSIDDQRAAFIPVLWDEMIPVTFENEHQAYYRDSRISQVWFAGVHANVGGGYPKQGLSVVSLDWMMTQAEKEDLHFLPKDRQFYREHANFDDKLYDSRSGLGVFYEWRIRNIQKLCEVNESLPPQVHLSVFERIAHGAEGYAPGNLPDKLRVAITDEGSSPLLQSRAASIEDALKASPPRSLDSVRWICAVGRISYWLYLGSTLVLCLALSVRGKLVGILDVRLLLKGIAKLIVITVTSPLTLVALFRETYDANRMFIYFVACGFFSSYVLSVLTEQQLSKHFSHYWNTVQPKLRAALKRARASSD